MVGAIKVQKERSGGIKERKEEKRVRIVYGKKGK